MKLIITEEVRFHQGVIKYAIKHDNNSKSAIVYDILNIPQILIENSPRGNI